MGLFYTYCKLNAKLVSKAFFERLIIHGEKNIPTNKPVLLAVNHPNSFLDGMILAGQIKRETYFLARGDAFKNNLARPILQALNMLPIYRFSEGKENLGKNNETFDACQKILEQKKMVILFAEGLSVNNWDLRPMRKGLARLALKAWKSTNHSNELEVIPIGLTYEHYEGEGKIVLVNIGKPIVSSKFDIHGNEALFVREFNQAVLEGLANLIPVLPDMQANSQQHLKFRTQLQQMAKNNQPSNAIVKALQSGIDSIEINVKNSKKIKSSIVFWPLYLFNQWLARKLFKQSLFHDSIIFGFFILLWPLYVLLVYGLIQLIF